MITKTQKKQNNCGTIGKKLGILNTLILQKLSKRSSFSQHYTNNQNRKEEAQLKEEAQQSNEGIETRLYGI